MNEHSRGLRIGLLAFLGLVAFAPTLRLPFQFDDHAYLETNPYLRRWDWPALKHDLLPGREGPQDFYYRPLQTLVNRLQFSAVGLKPWSYHLTNLIFHIGNAILLTELLLILGISPLAVLAAGALFVVHPIIVSELLMVSGLPEIMCFFFSLAALLALIRQDRPPAWAWIFYALALLSKESSLAVPVYYAILCRLFLRPAGENRRASWRLLIAVTLVYLGWRAWALGLAGISIPLRTLPFFFLGRLPVILLRYAALILFPWNLHAYRLIPAVRPLWIFELAPLAIGAYAVWGKSAWTRFSLLWGFAAFIPKIPLLISGHYMLDHWAYPALPALLVPLGILLARGWESARMIRRRGATVACSVFLSFFIFSAQFHTRVRSNDEKNYRWSLRFTRATPILFNLGLICLKTGRAVEAVSYIEPVQRLYPDDPNIRHALADAYVLAGRTADAHRLLK